MPYQLKCKTIALTQEARAFKFQEQREKRLNRVSRRDQLMVAGHLGAALALDAEINGHLPARDYFARMAKWKKRAEAGKLKARSHTWDVYNGIRNHRLMMIRTEARATELARAFLAGKSYRWVENFAWTQPNWDRVEKIAMRYGGIEEQVLKQRFSQWRDEALNGVKPKWSQTVVPGSIKQRGYDPDWINMQTTRNSSGE